jgi:hypothetical protein
VADPKPLSYVVDRETLIAAYESQAWSSPDQMADMLLDGLATLDAARQPAPEPTAALEPIDLRSEDALDMFVAGLDSKWHTPESRRSWCRLFLRDAAMGVLRLYAPTPSAAPPKDRQEAATFGDTTPSAAPDPRLVEAVENLPIMFVEDAESEARMAVVSRYAVLALLRPDILPAAPAGPLEAYIAAVAAIPGARPAIVEPPAAAPHEHEYVHRDGWWCSCGLQFDTDDPRPRLICAVCAKPKGVADIHAFDHDWEPIEDYLASPEDRVRPPKPPKPPKDREWDGS